MTETPKAYEKVEHYDGEGEPKDAGWYIVYYDADGAGYDAVGPYESEAFAIEIMEKWRGEE
jgi:hypothetical protein